jgi:hypothetical protein
LAENSFRWTTSGAPTGDQQASYSQADDADILRVLAACAGFEGVAPGFEDEMACSDGGSELVDVATGGAVVDGKAYINDAVQNIAVPAASGGGNTRIDRIVLRADWANFNVSVHRIAGTDAASPTAPSITQTSETTYDIMLCQALVDTSGNITVTDERVWAAPQVDNTTIEETDGALNVKALGIDTGQLAADAVTGAKIAADAVTGAKIAADAVTGAKIADNAIDSEHYVDGSIDTAHIANDQVDDTKVGNRVPQFYRRQGGSATDWSSVGTTSRIPGAVRMQAGALYMSSADISVTFPTAFSEKPIVLISMNELTGVNTYEAGCEVHDITTTGFKANLKINGSGTSNVMWLAIGPE